MRTPTASGITELAPTTPDKHLPASWPGRLFRGLTRAFHDPYHLALLSILLLALVLRLYRLDNDPAGLYYDEVTSTYGPYLLLRAGPPLSALPSLLVSIVTGTLPIYFLTGPSVFFTRLPPALYGTLFVIPIYLLGSRLVNRNVGILSALLAAVVPWSVQMSRYGIISSSYAFYAALYVYFLVAYCQTKRLKYQVAFALALIASLYTHAMALPFGFLFLATVLPSLHLAHILPRRRDPFVLFAPLIFGALPYLALYTAARSGPPSFTGYSAFSVSKGALDLLGTWADSVWIHLSPDFLVFTSGRNLMLPSSPGFTHRGSTSLIYYYGDAGFTGLLNLFGILVYPGLITLGYLLARRQWGVREVILSCWVVSYALASGYAYYDNPNAARNMEGLGCFVILVGWVLWTAMDRLLKAPRRTHGIVTPKRKTIRAALVLVGATLLIVAPTAQYLNQYYGSYPSLSARDFDYEYRALADYLNANGWWNRSIYIYDDQKWYGYVDLSYYNDSARDHISQVANLTLLLALPRNGNSVLALRTMAAYNVTVAIGVPLTYRTALDYPDGSLGFVVATF